MDKSVIGLVMAIGAATPIAAAQASVVSPEEAHQALQASSIADLLRPLPNSSAVLAVLDSELKSDAEGHPADGLQTAQWHHHHHHHHWWHHHHHHHWYHHHHHHHHWWHHHHHWD